MEENMRGLLKFAVGVMTIIILILFFSNQNNREITVIEDDCITTTENYGMTTTSNDIYTINASEEINLGSKLIVAENFEGDYFQGKISIPRTLVVERTETIEIIEPYGIISEFKTENSEEKAKLKNDALMTMGIETEEVYGNNDGTITIVYDNENFELTIQYLEKRFNETISSLYNKVSVNKQFNHLIIYINKDSELLEYGYDIVKMVWCMTCAQIYTGVPCHEWNVNVTTVYEDTGNIMFEYSLNENKNYNITGEEWDAMLEQMAQ